MRYTRLGKSDLRVSRLGLDCYSLGVAQRDRGWDPFSYDGEVFAMRTVHAALDAGVNVFDTSPDGAGTRSETLLGKALRERSQDIVLTTRLPFQDNRMRLREALLASMRRMRAERLGIVYLSDNIATDQRSSAMLCEDRLDKLTRLRDKGYLGYIGLSVSDPAAALPLIRSGAFDVVQLQCDVRKGEPADAALDACQAADIGVSIVKPLARGTLKTMVGALDSEWHGSSLLRECCLRYLLADRRVHLINVGMRWEHEVATNSRLFAGFDPASTQLAATLQLAQ